MNFLSSSLSSPSFSSPMALSSTIRFSSAFLRPHHHHRHSLFLPPSSRRFLSLPPSPPPPPPSLSRILSKDKDKDSKSSVAVANNDSGRVLPVELHEEMTGSYITYSMSVLLGRALPDVRDGLKPVHRRIL